MIGIVPSDDMIRFADASKPVSVIMRHVPIGAFLDNIACTVEVWQCPESTVIFSASSSIF